MRGFRRIIAPVSWTVLLAWILGLFPETGLWVHAHPQGDTSHVHLDELIAEAIGHRRHPHRHDHGGSAGHRHLSSRAVQRGPRHGYTERHSHEPLAVSDRTSHRMTVGTGSVAGTAGDSSGGARQTVPAELRFPSGAHAHASSPFLLLVLAALVVLLFVTRVVAIVAPSPVALRDARHAQPRARAPPLLPGGLF